MAMTDKQKEAALAADLAELSMGYKLDKAARAEKANNSGDLGKLPDANGNPLAAGVPETRNVTAGDLGKLPDAKPGSVKQFFDDGATNQQVYIAGEKLNRANGFGENIGAGAASLVGVAGGSMVDLGRIVAAGLEGLYGFGKDVARGATNDGDDPAGAVQSSTMAKVNQSKDAAMSTTKDAAMSTTKDAAMSKTKDAASDEIYNQQYGVAEYKGKKGERAFSNIRPEDRDKGGNLTVVDNSEGHKANLAQLRGSFERAAAAGDIDGMNDTAMSPSDHARLGSAMKQQEQAKQQANALAILNADNNTYARDIENKLRMPGVGRAERSALMSSLDNVRARSATLGMPERQSNTNSLADRSAYKAMDAEYEEADRKKRIVDLYGKVANETDPAKRQELAERVNWMQGNAPKNERDEFVVVTKKTTDMNGDTKEIPGVMNKWTGEISYPSDGDQGHTNSGTEFNDKSVSNFIDRGKNKGLSVDDFRKSLVMAGMNPEQINQTIKRYAER